MKNKRIIPWSKYDKRFYFPVKETTTIGDWNQQIKKDTNLFSVCWKNQRTLSKNPIRMLILTIGKHIRRSYFNNFSLNNIAE